MHPVTAAETAAQESLTAVSYQARLYVDVNHSNINPGGIGIDVNAALGYNPLLSATVTADLDSPVTSAEFRLHLGNYTTVGAYTTNLSPYVVGGVPAGDARPLFDPGHYIALWVRVVPEGGSLASYPWRPIFKGRIDMVDPGGLEDILVVKARDLFCDMLDTWIEPNPNVATGQWQIGLGSGSGGLNAPAALQEILAKADASTNNSMSLAAMPFATIGSTALNIPTYYLEPAQSTLLAMREVALQNGWDLRGRWGTPPYGADIWVMTYYEPDRAKTGPRTVLGPEQYYNMASMTKDRDEVRNSVIVTAADAARSTGGGSDNPSVAKYGRKYLALSEDLASHINSAAEASALGTAILMDLKEPKVGAEIECRFRPWAELNDLYELAGNFVQQDGPRPIVALSGFTHTLSEDGDAITVLRTRGTPAAANQEWRAPTRPVQWTGPDVYVRASAPVGNAAKGTLWVDTST